ncbi:MAG: hypothetical protein CL666_14620 [Balneola sp.]|nr:hypothetical protein [Balneola sp.]|tara:strand:+ start:60884 stop:61225 length:342 start_codon:yes stop_codon:yes gene_type:complete
MDKKFTVFEDKKATVRLIVVEHGKMYSGHYSISYDGTMSCSNRRYEYVILFNTVTKAKKYAQERAAEIIAEHYKYSKHPGMMEWADKYYKPVKVPYTPKPKKKATNAQFSLFQ